MYSLADQKEFSELWAVVQILLLLSHGQATVERGFSVKNSISILILSYTHSQLSILKYFKQPMQDILEILRCK